MSGIEFHSVSLNEIFHHFIAESSSLIETHAYPSEAPESVEHHATDAVTEADGRARSPEEMRSGLARAFLLLRLLGESNRLGLRLSDLADQSALPRPTVLRILRSLCQERAVDYEPSTRRYHLGIDLFVLGAQAACRRGLRDVCRVPLMRLTESLGETVFLLVRSAYDAVCIDRSAGPLPIRSFTGDIGGRVPLGIGQASTAILACLPDPEIDDVVRHNLSRIRDFNGPDEASLRGEIARVRRDGWCAYSAGLIPGMAGLGVPIFNHDQRPVAAISIGTTTDRLGPERLEAVAAMLIREAAQISSQIHPFDPTLRRAAAAMA